jgi:hypothetical protein
MSVIPQSMAWNEDNNREGHGAFTTFVGKKKSFVLSSQGRGDGGRGAGDVAFAATGCDLSILASLPGRKLPRTCCGFQADSTVSGFFLGMMSGKKRALPSLIATILKMK